MTDFRSFDVAIVGSGIAGCHLAQLLANGGVSVCLVDQHPLEQAGPQWINAVPLWMFEEASLSHPTGNEIFHSAQRFIIRSPTQKHNRVIIEELDVFDIHMGLLGRRLKKYFLSCSKHAHFVQASIANSTHDSGGRIKEIAGRSPDGRQVRIKAGLFVDSSGLRGVLRRSSVHQEKFWPEICVSDFCTAVQQAFEIKDRSGAQRFLQANDINSEDILSDVGFSGGYSLFRVQIDKSLDRLSLLCGTHALPQFNTAHKAVKDFLKENDWIGNKYIDGRGAIPINAPYHQLIAPGLALLGDSACQVYAAHGSGIGMGLIAAKLLFDTIILARNQDLDIGAIDSLIAYQQRFHKQYYQRLYFSEQFRRFSENLSQVHINSMIKSGLLNSSMVKQTLRQDEPGLCFTSMRSLARGAFFAPRRFISMASVFKEAVAGRRMATALSRKLSP